ncbi:hypothetical protein NUW58_g229 [Xylaria curta]|uniref:Uncharacterized protein n=1 Tax=Xylaria curta TaxID=42375 RepID=A0ACC1PRG1_9PEZI|nr:hypothetical protein NUW58_g229 [Xylaria curta]
MSLFGNFNASAAAFRPEATNALVNVNLEFNIFTKRFVDPPPEYAGVGQHLTTTRRREAQDGTRHGVARLLGTLFKDSSLLPSTPELIKAYGSRASEISRTITANPRGNESHGAFADMIGADATTLWAAATSGRSAIQCHLLACLLARIWEPPEATSIWVEIIAKRKRTLQDKLAKEGELEQEVLLAVASDISRSDLFDWDASARAWLRVADQVMKKQQTQAKLIIDNLDMPVNSKADTYDSVIYAWASSMTQMEQLLRGTPLHVYRGDVLLGLLSWHLYPDMKCLFAEERTIEQHDPLLKGHGILTLGLEPSPRVTKDRQSVYWALPLAHLRYYGRLPVTRVQSMRTSDRDRLTVDEMLWAWASSYVLAWHHLSIPTSTLLQFVSHVAIELHYALGYDTCASSSNRSGAWLSSHSQPSNPSWLRMLSRVCLQYKDSLHEERIRKLQALGRRFHRAFDAPFNGIFNVETYLVAGRSTEAKIKLLREIVLSKPRFSRTKTDQYEYLIVYKHSRPIAPEVKRTKGPDIFEYATALPESGTCVGIEKTHRRWIAPRHVDSLTQDDMKLINDRQHEIRNMKEMVSPFDPNLPAFTLPLIKAVNEEYLYDTGIHPGDSCKTTIINQSTVTPRKKKQQYRNNVVSMQTYKRSKLVKVIEYIVVLGSLDNVALLQRRDLSHTIHQSGDPDAVQSPDGTWPTNELTIQQILTLFRPEAVDFKKCAESMHSTRVSLQALTLIESLYKNMGDATIDVRAVGVNFDEAKWVRSAVTQATMKTNGEHMTSLHNFCTHLPYCRAEDVDAATRFACIAMMETGSYDLDPRGLRSVFGLCASDSLYIASCLLRDPADVLNGPPIQRYTGNIGKAGMAFMVPPKEPEIRRYDLIDEWYQYDHNIFTGKMEDCFKGTSLHISFSQASQAVNVNFSGGPDIEAYFLETLISVYSRAQWIAELDVLSSISNPNLKSAAEILRYKTCNCKGHDSTGGGSSIISIDNFAEMLVPPNHPGIIRADGNWQARLAATSLCIAKGYRVVIKDKSTCLVCIIDKIKARGTIPNHSGGQEDVLMIL